MSVSTVRYQLISKLFLAILVVGWLLTLTGCWVYSVEPLYEKNAARPDPDLTFDQNLLGSWIQSEKDCPWILAVSGDRQSYELNMAPGPECKSEDKPSHYEGHLLKLGNSLVLDAMPQSVDVCDSCLPLHSFMLVLLENDSLTFVPMDQDWLVQAMKDKKVSLSELERHEPYDQVVLTSSSKELKEFVRKYAADKAAFGGESGNGLRFKRR